MLLFRLLALLVLQLPLHVLLGVQITDIILPTLLVWLAELVPHNAGTQLTQLLVFLDTIYQDLFALLLQLEL